MALIEKARLRVMAATNLQPTPRTANPDPPYTPTCVPADKFSGASPELCALRRADTCPRPSLRTCGKSQTKRPVTAVTDHQPAVFAREDVLQGVTLHGPALTSLTPPHRGSLGQIPTTPNFGFFELRDEPSETGIAQNKGFAFFQSKTLRHRTASERASSWEAMRKHPQKGPCGTFQGACPEFPGNRTCPAASKSETTGPFRGHPSVTGPRERSLAVDVALEPRRVGGTAAFKGPSTSEKHP